MVGTCPYGLGSSTGTHITEYPLSQSGEGTPSIRGVNLMSTGSGEGADACPSPHPVGQALVELVSFLPPRILLPWCEQVVTPLVQPMQ